jgi:hypothetical protein
VNFRVQAELMTVDPRAGPGPAWQRPGPPAPAVRLTRMCQGHRHLEPWQCSISYVKHTIFVYYDIDSILTRYRASENDVRYRDTILNSISKLKYSISMHYDIEWNIDIEPFYIDIDPSRYRRNIDIERFFIDINSSRYRRNVDIELQNFDIGIYRYRTVLEPIACWPVCGGQRWDRWRFQCTRSHRIWFSKEWLFPMWAWSSLSTIAVDHGWSKEPSDNTGEIISYTISYTILYTISYTI